jgi:hypothetical protein
MSLPDLLQWAQMNRKTGGLSLDRGRSWRCIFLRDGQIVGCSANDPPVRLGQFLLSRGKITREDLQRALARQEEEGKTLGLILLEQGVLRQEVLLHEVAAKAEETIYGLFDWADADFRFEEDQPVDRHTIEVDLAVQNVVLNGLKRMDELNRIRSVFTSSGVVLRQVDPGTKDRPEISAQARRILGLVDGRRTLAEILLHAHMPEFLALKLLFELHRNGLVRSAAVLPIASTSSTLLDVDPRGGPDSPGESDGSSRVGDTEERAPSAMAETVRPAVPRERQVEAPASKSSYAAEIDVAGRLMLRGEHDVALEVLNACQRANAGDPYLRQLITEAEANFVEASRETDLSPRMVPVLLRPETDLGDGPLSSEERFFVSLIDGQTDIRSLLWVSPLREVEVLRILQRMLHRELIALRDPQGAESRGSTEPTGVPA